MYVVYVTCYRGNRLPPFYIGYTSEFQVSKGYNGTVKSERYKAIWRQERVSHPELFKTIILSRHSTKDEALAREEFLQRFFDVPNNPMYVNMAIARVGFRGANEHPKGMLNKHHTMESKEKIRKTSTGKKRGKYKSSGKPRKKRTIGWKLAPFTDAHRLALSISHRGPRGPYKTTVCPHCGLKGGVSNLKRFHFDNCKTL